MSTPTTAAPAVHKESLFKQLGSLPRSYWMVNIMEILERLAYYGMRVVIPIYIAQADEINGLHFTQIQKGTIFAWWALVQSLVPMFTGGFADRYGYKKTIAVSLCISICGYILMGTQREFATFFAGCLVLALGTATFKPGVQGTMCQALAKSNSSIGWGIFYMMVNIGGFMGPPLAHFLYGISWPAVFFGCAVILSLNFLMLLTYKEVSSGGEQRGGPLSVLSTTFIDFFGNIRLVVFVLIMAGFWLMFNVLFDVLPNFIVDWVDSSRLVATLHIPQFMLQLNSQRGPQLSQEWMINANSGLIILCVVFVSWMVSRMRRVSSILMGVIVASFGMILAGYTTSGYLCLLGILVYSVGEMLSSPKMNEYLGVIAPEGRKGLYMGYANVPVAIGWFAEGYIGGWAYDKMGDKANLAADYLATNFNITDVARTDAMAKLMEVTKMNATDATNMLWSTYHPYEVWYSFAAIGFLAAIALFFYSRWVKKYEAPDV
ncbi:transporter [candidate division GN15 bacterium]|uniref:Transporter n=1 Tax=candidate division GN15 bacterium TaxID=2072418 RepID=A0A855XCK7_9BACT|nr:MAG: transporter [candidate division GN15 bacterium]